MTFQRSFTVHKVEIVLDGDGYLDDRLIIEATAPDGVRRSLSVRAWYEQLINGHYEEDWQRMGAMMLQHAHKVEQGGLIKPARRDCGFLQL
jgi:hypothetical protein